MENRDSKKASDRWSETSPEFEKIFDSTDLFIRTLAEVDTSAKVLLEDMYFEGADILHCVEGMFVFSFRDADPVVLRAGETLVLYPGHYVTIKATARRNRLIYGVFEGAGVDSYLTSCGLFDRVYGKAASQYGSFRELKRMVENGRMEDRKGRNVCLGLLHDMIRTMKDEFRRHGDTLLFDAIKRIHENLRARVVSVQDLCRDLGTSRTHLCAVFKKNGFPSPGEYIRREQLKIARVLLSGSRLSIAEIAYRIGFKSSSHFNQFMHRMAGVKPGDLRKGE